LARLALRCCIPGAALGGRIPHGNTPVKARKYYIRVMSKAFQNTYKFTDSGHLKLLYGILSSTVVFGMYFVFLGELEFILQWRSTLLLLCAAIITWCIVFIVSCLLAPYQLHQEYQSEAETKAAKAREELLCEIRDIVNDRDVHKARADTLKAQIDAKPPDVADVIEEITKLSKEAYDILQTQKPVGSWFERATHYVSLVFRSHYVDEFEKAMRLSNSTDPAVREKQNLSEAMTWLNGWRPNEKLKPIHLKRTI
jgi:large-conductance mechanosensitive channel